ncbi:hypothetical protein M431DRAFT_318925 [Trichoderma harzianum CBS 226.95]|uniref:Secreted protein n=1 Tax=Trichoderma harzianum CBS 226.95 TaxID=983964 RepID=A0A2T3ZWJ9_TRIHA|nr:hypothetical protein M431DRAFT_318925 [Trichoderma harzianum CBS 226.95]PTB49187.1 hypothetical protein M431DRAFT_318925 [Trichoderma harzianum CBS 226.95]
MQHATRNTQHPFRWRFLFFFFFPFSFARHAGCLSVIRTASRANQIKANQLSRARAHRGNACFWSLCNNRPPLPSTFSTLPPPSHRSSSESSKCISVTLWMYGVQCSTGTDCTRAGLKGEGGVGPGPEPERHMLETRPELETHTD